MVSHLFIYCHYSKQVWRAFNQQMGALLDNVLGRRMQMRDGDIKIGDLIEEVESFQKKTACWGYHRLGIAAFMWHLWGERNQRFKEAEYKLARVVATSFIQNFYTLFVESKYKAPCRLRLEREAVEHWTKSPTLIIDQ